MSRWIAWSLLLAAALPAVVSLGEESRNEARVEVAGRVIDEKANGIAGVKIRGVAHDETLETNTGPDGSFTLAVKSSRMASLRIVADDVAGDRIGLYRSRSNSAADFDAGVEIRLGPTKRVSAFVSDSEGAAAPGVEIGAIVEYACASTAVTDGAGKAVLRIPSTIDPQLIYAWKADVGFDYRTGVGDAARQASPDRLAAGEVQLQLAEPRPVQVRLIDGDDAPIAGAEVQPWLLKKPGETNQFVLSVVPHVFRATTDERGIAAFRGLPGWNEEATITFLPKEENFEHREIEFDARKPGEALVTAKLHRLVAARGRVIHVDGRPASGIEIVAVGQGHDDSDLRKATTDGDGIFELRLEPEKLFIFAVRDEQWAAPAIDGVVVRAGASTEGLDFELRPATRLFGTVTGTDGAPAVKRAVMLQRSGRALHELPGDPLPAPNGGENRHIAPTMSQLAATDEAGRYEFFVGPGTYDLQGPPQVARQRIVVDDQGEVRIDFAPPIIETRTFAGLVVKGDASTPVAGAKIEGFYREENIGRTVVVVTDENGRFATKRRLHPMTLLARSADGSLAGIVEVELNEEETTIVLAPLASAQGRLVDRESGEPMSGKEIGWGRRIYLDENRNGHTVAWGGKKTTDAEGRFNVDGLVLGQEYWFTLVSDNGHTSYGLRKFVPRVADRADLGDLSVAPPYVPPTFEERVEKQLVSDETPVERYEAALEKATSLRQNVVAIFVDRDSPLTEAWFRLRLEDSLVRRAASAFQFVYVDAGAEGAEELAERLGVTLEKEEMPLWVFRDAAGEELEQAAASIPRSAEDAIDKASVLTTLASASPEPLDANQLLKDALAEAKAANKRVLVQETATWCGPCHLLAHFLERNRAWWEQDYLWVRIDERWNGSDDVLNGIQQARGGIPWFAILDGDGKVLATSDGPYGNVGFPSELADIDHFMSMISSTRQRMTGEQLAALRKDLEPKE